MNSHSMATPLQPLPAKDFDFAAAQHLLNRAGFGGSPAQVRGLAEVGLDKAVDQLLGTKSAGPTLAELGGQFRSDIRRALTPAEQAELKRARQRGDEDAIARFQSMAQVAEHADREQFWRMQEWWLRRIVGSDRPLDEKLVLFWHGHFATGYRTVENSWHMLVQQDLFRRECAGNFANLVRGVVRDPAMLKYLDNDENRPSSPNENLARELMELFTLGEGNGYTENDIKEGARALTGMTFRGNAPYFDRGQHDAGVKSILGRSGAFGPDEFVSIILERPETAAFLARKLYRFFVNDLPTMDAEASAVVDQMAKDLRAGRYELRPALRTLFRSQHFYASRNRLSMIKSPIQLVAQTVRSLGTPLRDATSLIRATDSMGQELLQPPSVKGWDGGRAWINTATIYVRQNVTVYLVTGLKPGWLKWEPTDEPYAPTRLVEAICGAGARLDARETVRALAAFALGCEPEPARVDLLHRQLLAMGGTLTDDRAKALLCLIGAMPEYQLC